MLNDGASCVTSSPRHELKSKFYSFVLPNTLAVQLLGSSFAFFAVASSSCVCRLVANVARVLFAACINNNSVGPNDRSPSRHSW